MKHSKKKKRSKASKHNTSSNGNPPNGLGAVGRGDEDKQRVLEELMEAFSSVTVQEAASAYREANNDANKAAEILAGRLVMDSCEDQSTVCSSSSGNAGSSSSGSSGSGGLREADFVLSCGRQKSKQKKVIAAAGTVSSVLGKDYVRSSVPKRSFSAKEQQFSEQCFSKGDMEQFLCSMLGEDSELSMAVVRDVLCQCGYDIDKALTVLLELTALTSEQSRTTNSDGDVREEGHIASCFDINDNLTDRTFDSISHSSDGGLQEDLIFAQTLRNNSKVLSSESYCSPKPFDAEPELPQQVLECLFNMPTPKHVEHERSTMSWRDVVKKMTSLGQRVESSQTSSEAEKQADVIANGEEYHAFRNAAKQHWESMKFCYEKAATAFSNGERGYAAYLSEKGRIHNEMARKADEKASQDIFKARNRSIENVITIDLHGQHVKPAMRLLKLHLLFGAYVRSVRSFRVITGCGSHGVGKSKLKQSVINLLQKEGIRWTEENRGTLLIKLDGQTEFLFLDSDSDTD